MDYQKMSQKTLNYSSKEQARKKRNGEINPGIASYIFSFVDNIRLYPSLLD